MLPKFIKKKVITRREDNSDYLIRYTLFTCSWFSIKVHNILLSDYACLHDHPWAFITFILKGYYFEYTGDQVKYHGLFSLLYRPANFAHRLEVYAPVWTFVITFKKVRPWGFFTKSGWVEWFKYVDTESCD